MKNFFSNSLILIESLVILLPVIVYYLIGLQNKEFFINSTFIILLFLLFIFRNNNIRHMYFGFIPLSLSVIGSFFGFDNFVYIASDLSLSLFILAVLNMLLFKNEN